MSSAPAVAITQGCTAYNGLGQLYNHYWQNLVVKLMPALDRLVFSKVRRNAAVLDLCCGTGQLAGAMCRRGFVVAGLDGSEDMLALARKNAPEAELIAGDARSFSLGSQFSAVVSTGDSMNHMLTPGDLAAAFGCVYGSLLSGGVFVFDMNMAEAFETQWHKSSTVIGPDHLLYVRGRYDRKARVGTTDVTVFKLDGNWTRFDLQMFQRCYPLRSVASMLLEAGFVDVHSYPAKSLGLRGRLSVGRTFFACKKP